MDKIKYSQSHTSYIALLGITLGGFAIRMFHLGVQSLWYDETVSAYLASLPVSQLIAHTARDIHPPLYYVLLHGWSKIVGNSEWALAFFSVLFGVLLIPLVFVLARRLVGTSVGIWAALLVAASPYHLWYSQEVRMYTLGAALGLIALWFTLRILDASGSHPTHKHQGLSQIPTYAAYVVTAVAGLYVLYYFGFFLVALNLYVIGFLSLHKKLRCIASWLVSQLAVLALYVLWLPTAWRQVANPPVPPWRSIVSPPIVLTEVWTALSLGQSVEFRQVWPILLLVAALFGLGIRFSLSRFSARNSDSNAINLPNPVWLIVSCVFGPLLLIYGLSPIVPLYHVRYMFLYATPFYILVAAGLEWIWAKSRWLAVGCALVLLATSAFSIYQYHRNPRYATDDLRAAVEYLSQRWRPGDAVLLNAGYVYPAVLYYCDQPLAGQVRLVDFDPEKISDAQQPVLLLSGIIGGDSKLGWGDPASDFFATTQEETHHALTRVTTNHPRLWVVRLYDTVADPEGFVRDWLSSQLILFEDQSFAGPSYVHVQGFMSSTPPSPPQSGQIQLQTGITLLGWEVIPLTEPGSNLDVVLWWRRDNDETSSPAAVSLKLWGMDSDSVFLAAQQDEWPAGSRFLTPDWPSGQVVRYPMQIQIPDNLSAGQYWLDLEMYDTNTTQPLLRLDGEGHTIPLTAVVVSATNQ